MRKTTSAARADNAKAAPPPASRAGQGIVVIVNDEAITAYEIEQRARFLGLSANVSDQAKANFQSIAKSESTEARWRALQQEIISSNQGKSRDEIIALLKARQQEFGKSLQKQAIDGARASILPKLKKDAREELIEDRLKVQSAKKHGIEVTDDDVKALIKGLAERNKMGYDAFAQNLKGMGVDISTMSEKFRAQKAWRELVMRRWGAQVSVSQRDVDALLSSAAAEAGQDTVELQVQKISLPLPGKADQATLTKRFAEAEGLRRRLAGCKGIADAVKSAPDARHQDLKYIKPSTIAEPTRSMLLSAKDDDVLPPVTTSGSIDVYAVCGRRSTTGNEAQQSAAKQQLQMKQLDILAQRHLRNLRQEANIEYK